MKLSVCLLLCTIGLAQASGSYAQKATVNLEMRNQTVKEVLDEIEEQSDFSFFFNIKHVDLDRKVSVVAKKSDIFKVLETMFAGTDVSYSVIDRKIILSTETKALQQGGKKITGMVVDQSRMPVIGANVVVKGSTNGTITDVDGKFSLVVPENAVLQLTYIGYYPLEVQIGKNSDLQITMKEDTQSLDEVVVVGYGVQKKRDLTGAVSSVKLADAPITTVTTISHALAGKAAGLQVTQNSAQVGGGSTFRIRGAASTGAGNDPLVIIDGFPVSNSANLESGNRYDSGSSDNILESINPNDIESIEVLKDASSTAIYGSRAGHGVIIITTKRGKNKKVNVTYSGNMSVQNMKNGYDVLSAKEYMQQRNRYMREVYMKTNGLDVYKGYITLDPEHVAPEFVPKYTDEQIAAAQETDWFKEITRTGMQHSHNVSLNGGSETTQYMASVNYIDQAGIVKNNDMSRLTAKFNLDQIISKYVKVGFSLNLSRNSYDNVPLGDKDWENAGIITSAVRFSPIIPVYDEEGNYSVNPDLSQIPNPASLLEITDKTTKDRFLGSAYLQAEPVKGLILKAVLGVDRRYAKRDNYLPKTTMYGAAVNGQASINQDDAIDYLMDLTATYTKAFKNHSLTALVGYSFQQFNSKGVSAGNQDFLVDAFKYNNLGAGAYAKPSVGSWASKNTLGSYFGRINYAFMDRYLLTATVRADGAANFNEDHRWGYFPSVSLGWRFSDEAFMARFNNVLSNGKLRASYGQTGNSNIGNRTIDFYKTGNSNVFGEKGYIGVYASQLGNPLLTWETTSEYNIGLDLGFLNNRISAFVEYFNRTISDLLVKEKSLPSYNEISKIAANIGETKSSGVEFTLNTLNISNRDFTWMTDLTLSTYRDRWKKRDPNWKPSFYESEDDPIRAIFEYESDGLLQPGEKAPAHQVSLLPGQIKLKDLNNDGKLDDKDKRLLGSKDPGFIFGFNNTLKYKDFDLNIYFYGQANMWMGSSYYDSWATQGRFLNDGSNVSRGFIGNWSHDNQNTNIPSAIDSDYSSGDYNYKKIYFIRLRNLTLGYTIPISKKLLNRIRVYADVNNPFVITNWTGTDPETEGNQFSYPNVTSYSLGLDITF